MNDSETRKIKKALDNIIARISDDEYPISLDEKEYKDLLDVQKIMEKNKKVKTEKKVYKKDLDEYLKFVIGKTLLLEQEDDGVNMPTTFDPPVIFEHGFNEFYNRSFSAGEFKKYIDTFREQYSDDCQMTWFLITSFASNTYSVIEQKKERYKDIKIKISALTPKCLKGVVREIKGWRTRYRNLLQKGRNAEKNLLKMQPYSDWGDFDESFMLAAGYKHFCLDKVLSDQGPDFKMMFYDRAEHGYTVGIKSRICFLEKINAIKFIPCPLSGDFHGSSWYTGGGYWILNKSYFDSDEWLDEKWQGIVNKHIGNISAKEKKQFEENNA